MFVNIARETGLAKLQPSNYNVNKVTGGVDWLQNKIKDTRFAISTKDNILKMVKCSISNDLIY